MPTILVDYENVNGSNGLKGGRCTMPGRYSDHFLQQLLWENPLRLYGRNKEQRL